MQMDEERAEYLVERYADMILRIGYTWLCDLDDAKDITQNVLIKALGSNQRFEDAEHEKAWLIRVAINECHDFKKSAWFRRRVPLDDAVSITVNAPEPDGILELVERLPLKYRRVVYLRYYEGYTVTDIARLLGESPALVSTHLKRARDKLKTMLNESGGYNYGKQISEGT